MAISPGPGGRSVSYLVQFQTTGYQQASSQIKTYGQLLQQTGTQTQRMGRQTRTITFELVRWALAWQLVYRSSNLFFGGIRDGITSTIELDKKMRAVNTIAKLSEAQFEALSQQVRDFSVSAESGFRPAGELADALYQINSAGIVGAKSLDVLKASSIAATGGLTDVGTAATGIVSALNAYGFGAEQATRVSDVLFKTVEVGVPRFEDLSRNIGEVAPVAAATGVSLEELGLVWATVSRVLVDADMTTTGVKQAMFEFLRPTEAMRGAVQALGEATARDLLRKRGLRQAILDLNDVTGGHVDILFDNVRAQTAVLALVRELTDAQKQWGKVGREAGSAQNALNEMMKSNALILEEYRRQWENLRMEWVRGVLPTLNSVIKRLSEVMEIMRSAPKELGTPGASVFGPLTAIFAPGLVQRAMEQQINERMAFRQTPSEMLRRIAARKGAGLDLFADAGEGPEAPTRPAVRPRGTFRPEPTLEELMRLFESHQAKGEFTGAGELRAIGGILIPKAERELKAARDNLESIRKSLGQAAELSQEFEDAQRRVENLERDLVKLEADRVRIAQNLAEEARELGRAYQDALDKIRDIEIDRLQNQIEAVQRSLELSIEPLQKFRDLMGEAMDPDKAKALREEIQKLTLQQVNAEIERLQMLLKRPDLTPQERRQAGGQIIGAVQRRAGLQSQFMVENRQADFAVEQDELAKRMARIQAMIGARPMGDAGRMDLERLLKGLQDQVKEKPEFKREELIRPYQEAAVEIAKIQAEQVDKAFQKSADEARKIADAARQALIELQGDIAKIGAAWGTAAARAFGEAFRKGLAPGMNPPGFQMGYEQWLSTLNFKASGPNDPRHFYNFRAAYAGGAQPDAAGHLPSRYKYPGHPNLIMDGIDTRTGLPATPETRHRNAWEQYRMDERFVDMDRGPSSGVTIIMNDVDLTGKVSESAKRELVAAVMGITGDNAVQTERRHGTATAIA